MHCFCLSRGFNNLVIGLVQMPQSLLLGTLSIRVRIPVPCSSDPLSLRVSLLSGIIKHHYIGMGYGIRNIPIACALNTTLTDLVLASLSSLDRRTKSVYSTWVAILMLIDYIMNIVHSTVA
jgi:hypothetical protein